MADRYTTIFGDQIDATALGLGLEKDVEDNLKVAVDDTTVELSEDSGDYGQIRVKDLGITEGKIANNAVTTDKIADGNVTEAKLDIFNAPVDGYYLKYTTANGWTWADVDSSAVQDDDVICNEIPSGTIGGGNTNFTLANTPVAGTVQLYLNGSYQAPGVSADYTISGANITFNKAPRPNSILLACYIKS